MLKLRTIKMHRDGVDWPPPNKWCTDPWTLVRRAVSTLYGTCRPALGPAPADDCVRCMFWHSSRWPHICPGIHLCSDSIGNSYTHFDEFSLFVMKRESEIVIVNQRSSCPTSHSVTWYCFFYTQANIYIDQSTYLLIIGQHLFDMACSDDIHKFSGTMDQCHFEFIPIALISSRWCFVEDSSVFFVWNILQIHQNNYNRFEYHQPNSFNSARVRLIYSKQISIDIERPPKVCIVLNAGLVLFIVRLRTDVCVHWQAQVQQKTSNRCRCL